MAKKRKAQTNKPWCWYCDREFDDEKVLITHQKAKHFKCPHCHKKLNSASGLVIHVAQIHKENMSTVPNSVEGHDTPELEIFGMEGVPSEDLARHQRGEPIVSFKRLKVSEGGLLPLLAAQKASVPSGPDMRRDLLTRTSSSSLASGAMTVTGNGIMSPPPPALTNVVSPSLSTVTSASTMISGAPIYYPAAAPPLAATTTISTSPPLSSIVNAAPSPHVSPVPPSSAPIVISPPMPASGKNISLGTGSPDAYPTAPMSSLSSLVFTTITVPPSVDAATGKPIPGSIIMTPDPVVSMEERRSQLARYRYVTGQ